MQVDFKFRHTPHVDELSTYVNERIVKLQKFELKPTKMEVTFSSQKSTKRVDIHIRGQHLDIHAHHESQDYFTAIDLALEKLARQLARNKARVQDHKGHSRKVAKVS